MSIQLELKIKSSIHFSVWGRISGMLAPPHRKTGCFTPPREKQALPRPAEIEETCQQPATCRSNFHLDKSSLLILNQNYGMINVWTPHLSHTTPTQPNMHNGNGYYTVADMYHRVQSLLTSPKSPTATATCLHCYLILLAGVGFGLGVTMTR